MPTMDDSRTLTMKTKELTGAWLDYWTAVADGTPQHLLEIRRVPRTDMFICVRAAHNNGSAQIQPAKAMNYSLDWTLSGALIDKYKIMVEPGGLNDAWMAYAFHAQLALWAWIEGKDAREAVCRALVLVKLGEDVFDVEVKDD